MPGGDEAVACGKPPVGDTQLVGDDPTIGDNAPVGDQGLSCDKAMGSDDELECDARLLSQRGAGRGKPPLYEQSRPGRSGAGRGLNVILEEGS